MDEATPWPTEAELRAVLTAAQRLGAIGAAPLPDHVAQADGFFLAVADLVAPDARLLDLGSGGGLPGLVLAVRHPALRCTLLDGRVTRAAALAEAVERLRLAGHVTVVGARAEEAARRPDLRGAFDLVVSRGFGPPAVTAECAAGFLAPGGHLVVSDPPAPALSRWPATGCAELGLRLVRRCEEPFAFSVLRQETSCPDRYPRRVGMPAKRPLF
jgi:SAM-dependent methyltransferase